MSDTRVTLERGLVPALARTPQMSQAMVSSAAVGKSWAEANAPRDPGPRDPGKPRYAESFAVEPADVVVDGQTRRGAALVNTSPQAPYVEWVNGAHILARAVDAIERG